MERKCKDCKILKPLTDYYKDKTCKDGHVLRCSSCYEAIRKQKKLANLEEHLKKVQSFWLKHRYNITLEKYNEMLENQNNKCAICDKEQSIDSDKKKFCVDHCHKTGKIRGLLCSPCNRSLGQFQDDSSILRKAANYIDFYKGESNEL